MPHKPKRPCRWPGCSEQIAVEMDFRVRHVYEVHNDALKRKSCPRSKTHYFAQGECGIITIGKLNPESLVGAIPQGFLYAREEAANAVQTQASLPLARLQ